MAYNNNQERDNRPKAPFDLFSLAKFAPSPTAPGKFAMFLVDVNAGGDVTFTVRTGDPADKERMKDGDFIKMKLKLGKFTEFVNDFGDIIRHKGPITRHMVEQVRYRFDKDAGKRVKMDQPRDGIKLTYGKDADGIFFMALTQWKKTEIEFGFLEREPEFIFKHQDGTAFSDGEMSLIGARQYHTILSDLHTRVINSAIRQFQVPDQYKPPYVPQGQGGGNGGGGGNNYNRGGNSGGGGNGGGNSGAANKPAPAYAEMDDDIPY